MAGDLILEITNDKLNKIIREEIDLFEKYPPTDFKEEMILESVQKMKSLEKEYFGILNKLDGRALLKIDEHLDGIYALLNAYRATEGEDQ